MCVYECVCMYADVCVCVCVRVCARTPFGQLATIDVSDSHNTVVDALLLCEHIYVRVCSRVCVYLCVFVNHNVWIMHVYAYAY
jgi:hypothetical protein